MYDNTIHGQLQFSWYLSTRYLQELGLALQLIGIPTRHQGPKLAEEFEFEPPRLYVDPDEIHVFVCALPFVVDGMFLSFNALNPQWWFTWRRNQTSPICRATDMRKAAQIIGKEVR